MAQILTYYAADLFVSKFRLEFMQSIRNNYAVDQFIFNFVLNLCSRSEVIMQSINFFQIPS